MSIEAAERFLQKKTGKAYISLSDAKSIYEKAVRSFSADEGTYTRTQYYQEVGFMIQTLIILGSEAVFRSLPSQKEGFTQSDLAELQIAYSSLPIQAASRKEISLMLELLRTPSRLFKDSVAK